MPKVSIYLPDRLYQQARARALPLSSLTQQAIERALAGAQTNEWVARVRARPPRAHRAIDTSGLVEAAREEFGDHKLAAAQAPCEVHAPPG